MEELIKKIIKYFQNKESNGEQSSKKQYKKPSISKKGIGSIVFAILAYILITNSFFTVNEFDQAVVTRFGEVQVVIVEEITPDLEKEIYDIPQFENVKIRQGKGLFFKVPVIDQVEKYTSRLLTYNTLAREVTTSDKKKIVLDNNAQWVIRNPLLFRITVNNVRSANTKLDDIIYSKLNEKIGLTDGSTLISDKEYVYAMTNQIKLNTNEEVKNFGMEVIDVRIAKTELPASNYENIFNRMRTERQKIANKFRAEGEEQYKIKKAQATKEVTILKAEAYEKAQAIKGEGDALALETYANAYNKDPEFYAFYRTLESYKKTLGDKTKIVIGADSEFAKYLYGVE